MYKKNTEDSTKSLVKVLLKNIEQKADTVAFKQ